MKYVSLDIETTGLDKLSCQVVQIAAVVDDLTSPIESLPRFSAFVDWDMLKFEPYALRMHIKSNLMNRHFEDKNKKRLDATLADLQDFLDTNFPISGREKRTIAGKNVMAFDLPFLKENKQNLFHLWRSGCSVDSSKQNVLDTFSHRAIDPGTSFTDLFTDDSVVSLDDCKRRAGIDGKVSHDALDDALDVVRVVREIAKRNRKLTD